MDWLSFLSNIVGSLAWPGTIIVIIFLVRKPLGDLLPLLQRLKYKDLELEFGRRIGEVKDEVERELPGEAQRIFPEKEIEPLAKLAEISPRSAILEAWRAVEEATLEAAKRVAGPDFRNRTLTFNAIRFLEKQGSIDENIVRLLREIRSLRNEAAHAPNFALSKESALEYAASAAAVANYVKRVLQQGSQG
jgi:hypothetical protein